MFQAKKQWKNGPEPVCGDPDLFQGTGRAEKTPPGQNGGISRETEREHLKCKGTARSRLCLSIEGHRRRHRLLHTTPRRGKSKRALSNP
jgi:hypothetical protein